MNTTSLCESCESHPLSLSDFLHSHEDKSVMIELKSELHMYILQKVAVASKLQNKCLICLQDYFSCTRATHIEKSNFNIMDSKADSKDTLMAMLLDIYDEFVVKKSTNDTDTKYLVVEGNAKLYELLQSLKYEYSDMLGWLIPYPGDWHMLMNYQKALMKPYFSAGLKSLAEAAGYPVAAIKECSQFKRTHHFIMEAWEAIYRAMLECFLTTTSNAPVSYTYRNHVLFYSRLHVYRGQHLYMQQQLHQHHRVF